MTRSDALRIWLLGGFKVSVGPRTIDAGRWRLRKATTLVKLLALAPGYRLHREQAMDLLWPDLNGEAASNNLRQALHAARKALDPREGARYLASEGEALVLCPEGDLRVDVEAFEEAARAARRTKSPSAYEAALDLYAGELLPEDRYEGWAEERRGQLREDYLSLLTRLAWAYEKRADYGSAIEVLLKARTEEPANEEARVGLMRLYALSGQKANALRQYESLEETISQHLGTQPSASTRAFREEIASGRFPPEVVQPLVPPSKEVSEPPRQNLPVPRTSFVGRGRELTEIKRTLAMTRLLTLTGAGGSGKTRLALKAATDAAGAYPDGVCLVELAGLSEPELVPRAVARGLGLREQPDRALVEAVADHLNGRKLLLILDNCEHLVDLAANLADLLLVSCPHLKVLATSREPLGVEGEVLFSVPPLSVPAKVPTDPSEIGGYDSVRLFVDRTRMRLSGFSLTLENAPKVAEVCRKLDGIPLAIELAAARMGTLATEQLAERLEDSLSLLSAGPRTASPRQRTMRAALQWSYGLLSEGEKEMFARLSPFAGGLTLEAAEMVCSDEHIEQDEVLDLLSSLVNKSLVVAEASGEGKVRYRMLEPVRHYALEKLEESGEVEAVHHRHAAYFLSLAERAEPQLKGPGQVEWLGRLEEDNDNLRAAMAWLLEKGEVEAAVRLAFALWIFWLIHGHQGEGRRWIEAALAKGENMSAHTLAKALWVQASTYYGLASPEQLERICQEAASLFQQVGDRLGLAYALAAKASALMQWGDAEGAIALFEEANPLALEAGDKWALSGGLGHMGSIHLGHGDYERAARCFEEGLALSREIGNQLAASTALYGLAMAAQGQGDHERAAELYAEGLNSSAETGDKANIAYCLEGLAQVAAVQGETQRAVRLFGAAEMSLDAAGGALYAYVQDRLLHEQAVDTIRSRLDEAAFSAAWATGAAMSLGEAVEYALSVEEPAPTANTTVLGRSDLGTRPAPLTHRQEEIALLIAQGLSNRRIAEQLFVSERTVENHVSNILKKLNLSSREQVAARLTER